MIIFHKYLKKKLYKNKPILRKIKYEFDDYIVPTVTLKMDYEDKELFVRIVNSKPGHCDVIIIDNGKYNKCKLYINSFYEFIYDF